MREGERWREKEREREGLKSRENEEKKDIERDCLLQSLLPLSIYSLRNALEGQ